MMPDYEPNYFDDDEGGFPWDCDGGDDDLGNYDEEDDEEGE